MSRSPSFLRVAPLQRLLTHSRFLLTLRSQQDKYHSLILFRLTPSNFEPTSVDNGQIDKENLSIDLPRYKSQNNIQQQLYAMEAQCPHLGADMSHGDIEECESNLVIVCPWHRYDFDLRTGHSETGMKACTYAVQLRPNDESDEGEDEQVWVEAPEGGTNWRLIELRPVSEEFADPPPPPPDLSHLSISARSSPAQPESIVPAADPPKTLIEWAVLILNTADPALKVQRTRYAVNAFGTGQLKSIGHRLPNAPTPPEQPPREELYAMNVVDASKTQRRRNMPAMLHALANIEQWAIDLAWDIIARYGPAHPELPPAFFSDFTKMALDESKHFTLLTARLAALAPTTPYGSLPVHAALWESARATFGSLRARLVIIHLVHEARGLDVNPGTIARFRRAGDDASVRALEVIHADEVTHVAAGHRWFTWLCAREGVDPVRTFREEVRRGWAGVLKGPFNIEARDQAGMTRDFYEDLKEDADGVAEESVKETIVGTVKEPAGVEVRYEKLDA